MLSTKNIRDGYAKTFQPVVELRVLQNTGVGRLGSSNDKMYRYSDTFMHVCICDSKRSILNLPKKFSAATNYFVICAPVHYFSNISQCFHRNKSSKVHTFVLTNASHVYYYTNFK